MVPFFLSTNPDAKPTEGEREVFERTAEILKELDSMLEVVQ